MRKKPYAELKRKWARKRAEIKVRRELGETLESIARAYGITRQRVGQILRESER